MLKDIENNYSLTDSLSNAAGLSNLTGIAAGSADFNAITNLDSYTENQSLSSAISQYSSNLSTYQKYLNGQSAGNLLNTTV